MKPRFLLLLIVLAGLHSVAWGQDSYWSVRNSASGYVGLQDDAASTTIAVEVAGAASTDGALAGGDTTDAKSNDNGPTPWLPKAFTFNGTDDAVTTSVPWNHATDHTVCGWVYRPTLVGLAYRCFWSNGTANSSTRFHQSTHANIQVSLGNFSAGTTLALHTGFSNVDAWDFVAIKQESGNNTLYINGALVNTTALSSPTSSGTLQLARRSTSSEYFDGRMAGVSLHGALSDAQVEELYEGPEPTHVAATAALEVNSAGVTGYVGTWDTHSNGDVTYEWRVKDSEDTIVASGTGAGVADPGDFTPGETFTLEVRAENDGGYDVGDEGDGYYVVATGTFGQTWWTLHGKVDRYVPLQDNAADNNVAVYENGVAIANATLSGGTTATKHTTGPTPWLPSALDFDGVDDTVNLGSLALLDGENYATVAARVRSANVPSTQGTIFSARQQSGSPSIEIVNQASGRIKVYVDRNATGSSYRELTSTSTHFLDNNWHSIVVVVDITTRRVWFYEEGVLVQTLSAEAAGGAFAAYSRPTTIGTRGGIFDFDGDIADVAFTAGEAWDADGVAEWHAGPEPTSITAPAIGGELAVGGTLTVTPGTWEDYDNGSLTLSYQWQYDVTGDGVWVDIPGATADTYASASPYVGHFVRVVESGSNTGNIDPGEDIASNAVLIGKRVLILKTSAIPFGLPRHRQGADHPYYVLAL